MTAFKQYQLVRVKCLLQPQSHYNGWCVSVRPPSIGDIGTIVDFLHANGLPDRFIVECCQVDGKTVWLADFDATELEPYIEDQSVKKNRAHLVFLRSDRLLLVKRPEADWRQLQDDYSDFVTSLGPWTADEIASYFALDYTEDDTLWPFSKQKIDEFFAMADSVELSTE